MKKLLLFSTVCLFLFPFVGCNNSDSTTSSKKEPSKLFRACDYGKWGFVDKKGTFVIDPQFDEADVFSEGLACVRIGDLETGKYGYIDKEGKLVIDPQFDIAMSFSEGLAAVEIGGKFGFIDKEGWFVIEPRFDFAMSFSEGLASVAIEDKMGFINKEGRFVIDPQFDLTYNYFSGNFSEGLASVRIGNRKTGKYGYIDKEGKIVIKPQFDFARSFSEGLASVAIDDKMGFIDKEGKFVIDPQFDFAMPFSEGLASVMIDDKMGFIDMTGKIVINPRFYFARDFSDGLAEVRIGNSQSNIFGIIDNIGRIVYLEGHDVTTFLGIPVDGTESAMIEKLIEKGFTHKRYDGENVLMGEFNGRYVYIYIVTNNNKVYRIVALDANPSNVSSISRRFIDLVNNERKNFLENYIFLDAEDISYEMMVHKKEYVAVFYQDRDEYKPVRIRIIESDGKYRIAMYYDNVYNQPNDEDL